MSELIEPSASLSMFVNPESFSLHEIYLGIINRMQLPYTPTRGEAEPLNWINQCQPC